jgi:tripartite-type tricarboxylate transporter receptor subunit TctC
MGLIWKVIITRIVIAAALALVPVGFAQAQDWPSQPITRVVPFGPGGGTDVVARMIAPRMGEVLGQQIVIENVGGAGGMNGASRGAGGTVDIHRSQIMAPTKNSMAANDTAVFS